MLALDQGELSRQEQIAPTVQTETDENFISDAVALLQINIQLHSHNISIVNICQTKLK